MKPEKTWVGIDVRQTTLDVCLCPQTPIFQQPKTDNGVQALIAELQLLAPALVVVASTATRHNPVIRDFYHRLL